MLAQPNPANAAMDALAADPSKWVLDETRQPGNEKLALHNLAVALKGNEVVSLIDSLTSVIDGAANAYGVNPNLVKAIIFEEQTKQFPPRVENAFGGTTFGLGQMTAGYYGLSRGQLQNNTIAINGIARHLSSLSEPGSRALVDSNRFAASIGTFYNSANQTGISNYGTRIEFYFNLFSWRQQ